MHEVVRGWEERFAPLLGEHTEYVLGERLGLPQDEIDRLLTESAV